MQTIVLRLHIDQPIPNGEEGERIINAYIDELAKTNGTLSWTSVDWDGLEIVDETDNGETIDGRLDGHS
jgi:hypothetical protein